MINKYIKENNKIYVIYKYYIILFETCFIPKKKRFHSKSDNYLRLSMKVNKGWEVLINARFYCKRLNNEIWSLISPSSSIPNILAICKNIKAILQYFWIYQLIFLI